MSRDVKVFIFGLVSGFTYFGLIWALVVVINPI